MVPEVSTVDPEIAQIARANKGIAIVVEPLAEMATHVTASAKLRIYDAVGNVVWKSDAEMDDGATRKKFRIVFVWDGTNRTNDRYVGAGTYLGVLEIQDNQGFEEDERVWIGVKRE
jgi:hypothetical protein